MTNIMKDINICSDKCNDDDIGLIKLWNYLKKKIKNKKKKISSDDINELKEQNSDNESDKTSHEKNYPRNITRKRNSITSNSINSRTLLKKVKKVIIVIIVMNLKQYIVKG